MKYWNSMVMVMVIVKVLQVKYDNWLETMENKPKGGSMVSGCFIL